MKTRLTSQMCMNRRGQAIVLVLILSVAFVSLIGVLFFFSGAQRNTHGQIARQTKALLAANAVVQLAVYKYRVLTRDFYRFQAAVRDPATGPPNAPLVISTWMADLSSSRPGVAASLALRLDELDAGVGTYAMEVTKFDLVTRTDSGYRQDFLRIEAWGEYENERKTVEEFVEVQISH